MQKSRGVRLRLLIGALGAILIPAVAQGQEPEATAVRNWVAPPSWAGPSRQPNATEREALASGREPLAISSPVVLSFIAMTPCRIVDTRGNGQTGAFGTPQLSANTSRTIPVPTHPTCTGIPATAGAYSLNITVTNTGSGAFGYLQAWPTGQTQPTSSTLNYPGAGATLANAAVVPAGTAGSIDVFSGNASADVIIDINGYYVASTPVVGPCWDTSNRYVDCGNGTVTDTATNLIWLKNAGCLGTAAWPAANAAAASLASGQCGLTDGSTAGMWRLPTNVEWQAVLNSGCSNPGLNDKVGNGVCYSAGTAWATGIANNFYWGSTSAYGSSSAANYATTGNLVNGTNPTLFKSNSAYIWPVRSGH